jgi:biotin-dependent carboxylase-like uncharacterized protein
MPPAGAMDKFAYRIGNMLVGNVDGAASLEATYLGPELEFTHGGVVAVTGAEMPARINGEEVASWEGHAVKAGDVLSFDYLRSGARVYIAVSGGIDVPIVEGSRSTYTLCGMGGFEGRGLAAGDELQVGANGHERPGRKVDPSLVPEYPREVELRLVVGLSSYRLTRESLAGFFDATWNVTPDANRVGYRYRGIDLEFVAREQPRGAGSDPANVVDIGYPVGSIQIPGGVEPIALLNDAVTGGGYATIATIISADLDAAAQSKTNDTTRFVEVTLREALQARRDTKARLERVRSALAGS